MARLALQARSWYNTSMILLCLRGAGNTRRREHNLVWRFAMDMIPQDNTPIKQCKGPCKQTLPATSEFFAKKKANKDGFHSTCRVCKRVSDAEYARRYRKTERSQAYQKEYSKQAYQEHRDEKLAYQKEYTATHHEQKADYGKRRYEGHKDRFIQRNKSYYATHREQSNAQSAKYREAHPDTIKANQQRWMKENAERVQHYRQREDRRLAGRAHSSHRRALKKNSPLAHTAQDIEQQKTRQKGKCYYCHKKFADFHVDHIIPLSRGGSNGPDNIVVTCPTCNLSKNDRLPHEWIDGGKLL